MNKKNISPLYIYTEYSIENGVNVAKLQKALAAINNAIDHCCIVPHRVTNSFLNTFYILLKAMNKKTSLHKLQAVKNILTAKITCCGIDVSGE